MAGRLTNCGSTPGRGKRLCCITSKLDVGPTQHPGQIQEIMSLGVIRRGRQTDQLRPSGTDVKECVEIYVHSPICLKGEHRGATSNGSEWSTRDPCYYNPQKNTRGTCWVESWVEESKISRPAPFLVSNPDSAAACSV